jgi:hypothetical protein
MVAALEVGFPVKQVVLLGENSLPIHSRSAFGYLRANAYGTAIRLDLDMDSFTYRK